MAFIESPENRTCLEHCHQLPIVVSLTDFKHIQLKYMTVMFYVYKLYCCATVPIHAYYCLPNPFAELGLEHTHRTLPVYAILQHNLPTCLANE